MNTNATNVLVIEGDADAASLIGAYLEEAPGEGRPALTFAPRLSTALHLLAKRDFDVALLDVALPQAPGVEAYLRLAAMRPSLPVILLTGKKDEALALRAVRLGAQDYFIKGSPDFGLLRRALRTAVESKRLSGALEDLLAEDRAARLVIDSSGVVRRANRAAEEALGRPAAELLEKPFGAPLPGGSEELAVKSAWTRERELRVRARPFPWRGEEARLVTLTPAPRTAKGARGDAEEPGALEAKNHFLGRISHELRNTLATMKTAVYCLRESPEEKLTPQQAQMTDMISRNIDRQTRLVENILDLARLRSGKLRIAPREIEASRLVSELAAEYRLSRGARALSLRVEERLPPLFCDPDLIAQVLRNLLDNAARYAKEKITVEAARAGGDAVSFTVTDDGAGIPPEHLDGLFTLFRRLEQPEERSTHKGTGLGLAICREIVEGHNGRIRAENVPGAGARFRFELPARAAAQRPAAQEVTVPSQIGDGAAMAARGPRVL